MLRNYKILWAVIIIMFFALLGKPETVQVEKLVEKRVEVCTKEAEWQTLKVKDDLIFMYYQDAFGLASDMVQSIIDGTDMTKDYESFMLQVEKIRLALEDREKLYEDLK